ncbi:hypothetical protein M569_10108 [Genlisea aurea]|uniref:Exocyst subunit Exo70 family protein n=1 Tax=Genlisea aurea TaxID=192259 RepID=S8CJ26_9LAMI|nr:hypothetical protein M569_10108 [Genlisea aurea]
MDEANVEKTIELAESITRKRGLIEGIRGDFDAVFIRDVDARRLTKVAVDLQKSMEQSMKKISEKNSEQLIIKLQKLMQAVMKRLQMEFYAILCGSSSLDLEPDGGVVMADLRSIADCTIACGYGKECVSVYTSVRRSVVHEQLHDLRADRFPGANEMKKMEWKVVEEKVKRWIYLVQAAVNEVFRREKLLSRSVFPAEVAELCFRETCGDAAADLLRFPADFGNRARNMSPEKVFRTLDAYEALAALLPTIDSMFSGRTSAAIRSAAAEAAVNLRSAARTMIGRFRAAIQEDSSKPPANGGIHPLARYVMNFLLFLDDYGVLISDDVVRVLDPPRVFSGEDPPAIAWFVVALICKLNGKAATYDDVGLGYLFLANNLNYVVSKIRSSNLKLSVGSEWISGRESELSGSLSKYVESDWTRLISPLDARDPTVEIPREEAGEIFRDFNSHFRETYGKNRYRVIPDPELRTRVRDSLRAATVSPYAEFYDRCAVKYNRVFGSDPIALYTPEDLEYYVRDLFSDPSS